jgi:hypothetical protein
LTAKTAPVRARPSGAVSAYEAPKADLPHPGVPSRRQPDGTLGPAATSAVSRDTGPSTASPTRKPEPDCNRERKVADYDAERRRRVAEANAKRAEAMAGRPYAPKGETRECGGPQDPPHSDPKQSAQAKEARKNRERKAVAKAAGVSETTAKRRTATT